MTLRVLITSGPLTQERGVGGEGQRGRQRPKGYYYTTVLKVDLILHVSCETSTRLFKGPLFSAEAPRVNVSPVASCIDVDFWPGHTGCR